MLSAVRSLLTQCILMGVAFMVAFGSFFMVLPIAYAQPSLPPGAPAGPGGGGPSIPPPAPPPAPAPNSVSQPNSSPTYQDQRVGELSCNLWSLATEGVRMCIAVVMNTLMGMAAGFLSLAGKAFNWAVSETVVRMGRNVDGLIGLNKAWQVMRDFGNLIFVFALVLIGIATILRAGSYHYKNLLKSVIIGALLINFSLIIGKVIIDASNILATQIYSSLISASPNCTPDKLETPAGKEACANNGISGLITSKLRITSIHSAQNQGSIFSPEVPKDSLTDATKIIIVGAFGSIFILITTIVILGGTVMLVVRFIVLIFLLAFSPVAFAGMALPYTQRYAKLWWNKLLSQAFFAPAYLMMIYISITVMETPLIDGASSGTFADAILNRQGASGIIFMFMLVIGLMILSLVVAKQLGAYGASGTLNVVTGIGNSLRGAAIGAAGSATFGSVAAIGRATLGRDAYNDSQRAELQERASGKGVGAYAARIRLRSNDYLAKSSFDARRAGGGIGKQLQGAGLGKGKEGGFKKQVEEQKKAFEARAKQYGDESALTETQKREAAEHREKRRALENESYRVLQERNAAEARGESLDSYNDRIKGIQAGIAEHTKEIKDIDDAAKAAGKARKQQYGRSIQDEKITGFLTGTTEARAQAAASIRKGDTKAKDLKDAFKKFGINVDEDEDDKKKDEKKEEEKPASGAATT